MNTIFQFQKGTPCAKKFGAAFNTTSFAAINTYMVNAGHISFEKLVEIMAINPRKIFGIEAGIKVGDKADFTVVDRNKVWTVDPQKFVSAGKYTIRRCYTYR